MQKKSCFLQLQLEIVGKGMLWCLELAWDYACKKRWDKNVKNVDYVYMGVPLFYSLNFHRCEHFKKKVLIFFFTFQAGKLLQAN